MLCFAGSQLCPSNFPKKRLLLYHKVTPKKDEYKEKPSKKKRKLVSLALLAAKIDMRNSFPLS
jgi:hypothetical protein